MVKCNFIIIYELEPLLSVSLTIYMRARTMGCACAIVRDYAHWAYIVPNTVRNIIDSVLINRAALEGPAGVVLCQP